MRRVGLWGFSAYNLVARTIYILTKRAEQKAVLAYYYVLKHQTQATYASFCVLRMQASWRHMGGHRMTPLRFHRSHARLHKDLRHRARAMTGKLDGFSRRFLEFQVLKGQNRRGLLSRTRPMITWELIPHEILENAGDDPSSGAMLNSREQVTGKFPIFPPVDTLRSLWYRGLINSPAPCRLSSK